MLACRGIVLHIDAQKLAELGTDSARKVVAAAALILERDVKKMLDVPGTFGWRHGNVYKRRKDESKNHTASAAGEPPAVDTGRLMNSVVSQSFDGGNIARIGPSIAVDYAAELEDGNDAKHLKPRPFLRPVIDQYAGNSKLADMAARHVASKIGGK